MRLRAADVVGADLDAGNELGDRPRVAPGRHALEDFLAHHRLLQVRLGIDRRRLAGHRDGLVDAADVQLARSRVATNDALTRTSS